MRGIAETKQKEKENKVSGKKLQKWSIQEEKYVFCMPELCRKLEGDHIFMEGYSSNKVSM